MELSTAEKIKLLAMKRKISLSDLAAKTGQSNQNLFNKLKRDKFNLEELQILANALDCEFVYHFKMKDTGETL